MQVTYQLTPEDYRQGLIAYRKRTTFSRWSYRIVQTVAVGALALLMLFSLAGSFMDRRAEFISNLLPLIYVAIAWIALLYGAPYLSARSQFKGNPSSKGPITLEVSEEGFHTKSQFSDSNIGWGAIVGFVEMKTIFAIFPAPRIFYPIPKRAFTPDQLTEFRQLLKQNIKST
jgi:hypothetical protein